MNSDKSIKENKLNIINKNEFYYFNRNLENEVSNVILKSTSQEFIGISLKISGYFQFRLLWRWHYWFLVVSKTLIEIVELTKIK